MINAFFGKYVIDSKMRYFESDRPFRGEYFYNNWMYTLAGHVAERIAGANYTTCIKSNLI